MQTAEQPQLSAPERTRPGYVAPFVVIAGLAAYLYIVAIWWWVGEWTAPGSYYAHGIFIPFFVGLMVWRDRERLRRLPVNGSWWGLPLVILAAAMVLFAQRAQVTVTLSFSFVLFLIGACMLIAGKAITRALLFPMLFILTMIPIVPDQLINPVAFPIQVTSARMATGILNLVGFGAVRTGTQIAMPDYRLDVELPCSGFKTLVGLLSFAAAFAWLIEAAAWKRWLLFLMAGPLAVVVNGLRITLIGMVGETFSRQAAAAFHDYSGFIVLVVGFSVLFGAARLLKCERFMGMWLLDDPPDREAERAAREARAEAAERDLNERYGPRRSGALARMNRGAYPVIAVLAVACVVKPFVHPPGITVKPLESADIPSAFPGGWKQWNGDTPISPEVRTALNPVSWIDRNYVGTGSNAGMMNLLISAGTGRRVFHDPHTCFLGTGDFLRDLRVETIDTPAGPVRVQVAESENAREHTKSLLMFLYAVDGRQIHTTQGVNLAILKQTLLGESGRPSYFVRFWRPGASASDPEATRQMRDFVRTVWTTIAPWVVGKG